MINVLFILLGVIVGVMSGIAGIGGGVFIVPVLTFFFKFTQQQAQGTTLALLIPPIGLLAAFTYFQKGFVDIKAAIFICIGFFIGGLIGAKVAVNLPADVLSKCFGGLIIVIGLYMVLK